MRNSNSQYSSNQNRLTKTANNPKTNNENANINRQVSNNRLNATKMATKTMVQKKDYVVEENMTESKIYQAKSGLQLLKKKMNSTKSNIRGGEVKEEREAMKETKSKIQQPSYAKKVEKKVEVPQKTQYKGAKINPKGVKVPQKNVAQENVYLDEKMEAPIKPKKNFNALLQQQIRKEQKIIKEEKEYDEQNLRQCSRGCGRMFNEETIGKHEKICQKVFQSKRKPFNSAAHRALQAEGYEKPPTKNFGKTQKLVEKKKVIGGIPKWKQESIAFRAVLKQAKGQKFSEDEKKIAQKVQESMDTRIKCNFCGRKFQENAAKRHIPFCESKSKQIARVPAKKKK